MVDLVPIKVTLRKTNTDGSPRVDQHGKPTVYPSFRELPANILNGRRPHDIIEQDGEGWRHNRKDNLGTGAAFGEAVAFVPPDFAKAAIASVDTCVELTEAEAATFLDTKYFDGLPAVKRDEQALNGLMAERQLRVARGMPLTEIDAEIDKALNPDDETPGVTRAKTPTSWVALKAKRNIRAVKAPV